MANRRNGGPEQGIRGGSTQLARIERELPKCWSVPSCNHSKHAALWGTMEEGTSKSPSHCCDTGDEQDFDISQWDVREGCEVRQILDRVADKWSLLAIAHLERRTLRFSELRRLIDGISQRMLTVTLRQLERDGLVRRTVYPVVPPRVEYELTPMGATLHTTIRTLVDWTEGHQQEIARARAEYDSRQAAEAPVVRATPAL